MIQNKYVIRAIYLYILWTAYLFVLVGESLHSDGGPFNYKHVLYWMMIGLIFNSGLFLITTQWAQKYRKTAVACYLPTLLIVPQWFMLRPGTGWETHLLVTTLVLIIFFKGKKNEASTYI
jgi:hypothetical protein